MKRKLFILLYSIFTFSAYSQEKLIDNSEIIDQARKEITPAVENFFANCLVTTDCNDCIKELVKTGKNTYERYLIGGSLYNIDPEISYQLHKEAYIKRPQELNFNLEYAIESHRIGDYKNAIKHYEMYQKEVPNDYRVAVWLSECYLNIGNNTKAIAHWKKANHAKNHIGIDNAIYIIHGRSDQIKKRSELLAKIKLKEANSAYELVFLDMNWELDWWNTTIQDAFLEHDLSVIKNTFGVSSEEYIEATTYKEVKVLSKKINVIDSIQNILKDAKLILNDNPLPVNGKIASDLLRIAFINKLLNEKEFFRKRGNEIIMLANKNKDEELLNIYAYLEAAVTGKVSEATDKKGWNEYKSERFAISYFIGLADANRYDNPELKKALNDFPNSSKLQWVKLNCAYIEKKVFKNDLIALLKKEFKTLGSSTSRFSYPLDSYFALLETQM